MRICLRILLKWATAYFGTKMKKKIKTRRYWMNFFDRMGSCRICFMSFLIRFHHCCFFSYCSCSFFFVGIWILELKRCWYVCLVVLSCALQRKSSIFRFVVIDCIGMSGSGGRRRVLSIKRCVLFKRALRSDIIFRFVSFRNPQPRFHIDSWIYTSKLHGLIFILLYIIIIYAAFKMPNWIKMYLSELMENEMERHTHAHIVDCVYFVFFLSGASHRKNIYKWYCHFGEGEINWRRDSI